MASYENHWPPSPPSCLMACGIKRKRTPIQRPSKSVRFDTETEVHSTYSALEYDRGGRWHCAQYKPNPLVLSPPPSPPLSTPPPSSTALSTSSSQSSTSRKALLGVAAKKQRPKLSIDTGVCAGPLFLTHLSTNHTKFQIAECKDRDDVFRNDYLVPLSHSFL